MRQGSTNVRPMPFILRPDVFSPQFDDLAAMEGNVGRLSPSRPTLFQFGIGCRQLNDNLPGILSEIAEIIGAPAATRLAMAVGGTQIYIPARLPDTHWLIDVLGLQAARTLSQHFASYGGSNNSGIGGRINIPMGPSNPTEVRRKLVEKLLQEGKSTADIARIANISQRAVHRHRSRIKTAKR